MCGMRGLFDDPAYSTGMIIHAQTACETCLNIARMKGIKKVVHGFDLAVELALVENFGTQSDALVVQGFSVEPS